MNKILLSVFFSLLLSVSFGQSQGKMTKDAGDDYQKADKELNATYQKILKEYDEDQEFIKNLKVSQKLWIQFRDAEMKVKYPDREQGYYGSVQPMCWTMYLKELTIERTKKLKIWLTGIEEGDVCKGSVKSKH